MLRDVSRTARFSNVDIRFFQRSENHPRKERICQYLLLAHFIPDFCSLCIYFITKLRNARYRLDEREKKSMNHVSHAGSSTACSRCNTTPGHKLLHNHKYSCCHPLQSMQKTAKCAIRKLTPWLYTRSGGWINIVLFIYGTVLELGRSST